MHCLFSGLLSKSLVHCPFSGLFVCFARFLSTVCSLDCLFVMQESCALSVLQESRTLSVLWIVCLLRKSFVHCFFSWILYHFYAQISFLVHCLFSGLFVCYARVSRTVCSLDCLFAMQESRALFFLWIVCLLRKSFVHCFFSWILYHFYAQISFLIG